MPAPLLAALALLAGPPQHPVENWADERSALTSGPQYARSKATCRRLGEPRPPAGDRPTAAQTRALKGCDSEKLYYGEGARPDYVSARQCAFVDYDTTDDTEVFGGSTILMQVYANGLGVGRNLDLATAYACGIEGAPAEIDGRVTHLQDLKAKPSPKRFDYCDDITSGLAEGYCQSRASTKTAVGRDARLKALQARLPPAARALYGPVRKAFDIFVDAHGEGEVDLSGTARAAIETQEEDAVRDQFVRDLQRLLGGGWPRATDAAAADAALNASYRAALAANARSDVGGMISAEGVRKAQRAWLVLRDAYVRFAAAAAPATPRDAVLARLTRLRTAQLDALTD